MTHLRPIHWSLVSFAVCVMAVVMCMVYINRPLADFVQNHLRQRSLQTWMEGSLRLAPVALLMALRLLFAAGYSAWHGRALGSWARTPLLCAWSAVWALSAVVVLKRIFGRSCVNPNYLLGHYYGFQPFHGVGSYESFPSGAAAVATAILSVAWLRCPRLRSVWALLLTLLALALVVTQSHWISDIIGGVFLGALTGSMTTRFLRSA